MKRLLAQTLKIGPGSQQIEGPLQGIDNLAGVINKVIPVLVGLASVILLLVLIWGGIDFVISRGEPDKVKTARAKITTSLIGFILLVASFLFVKLLSSIFGLGQGIF